MFVESKLSAPSKNFETLLQRLTELHETGDAMGVRIPELLTAAAGLTAEAGEFDEIVKKMVFQGKPLDNDNRIHLKKELGDLFFYAMVACMALGVTGDEVIEMNKDKLTNRYKEGFTVEESENRVKGDIQIITNMEHPALDVNDIKEKGLEEIQEKLRELYKKQNFAYKTGNQPVLNQLQMVIEVYARAQQELLREMFSPNGKGGDLDDKIDVS